MRGVGSSVRSRFRPNVGPLRKPSGRTFRPPRRIPQWNRLPEALTGMWGAALRVLPSPTVPWNLRKEGRPDPMAFLPPAAFRRPSSPESPGYGPVLPFDPVVLQARLNPPHGREARAVRPKPCAARSRCPAGFSGSVGLSRGSRAKRQRSERPPRRRPPGGCLEGKIGKETLKSSSVEAVRHCARGPVPALRSVRRHGRPPRRLKPENPRVISK